MGYDLLVKPEASEDIIDIARWYESKRIGLGEEFLDSLESTFEWIRRNP